MTSKRTGTKGELVQPVKEVNTRAPARSVTPRPLIVEGMASDHNEALTQIHKATMAVLETVSRPSTPIRQNATHGMLKLNSSFVMVTCLTTPALPLVRSHVSEHRQ